MMTFRGLTPLRNRLGIFLEMALSGTADPPRPRLCNANRAVLRENSHGRARDRLKSSKFMQTVSVCIPALNSMNSLYASRADQLSQNTGIPKSPRMGESRQALIRGKHPAVRFSSRVACLSERVTHRCRRFNLRFAGTTAIRNSPSALTITVFAISAGT